MAKKKLKDDDLMKLCAEFIVNFKDTMINAGASSKQMIEAAQTIAMSITLEGVGTGAGSRTMLTEILNSLREAYLTAWEEQVEQKK